MRPRVVTKAGEEGVWRLWNDSEIFIILAMKLSEQQKWKQKQNKGECKVDMV